jgi:hypothetical protein
MDSQANYLRLEPLSLDEKYWSLGHLGQDFQFQLTRRRQELRA